MRILAAAPLAFDSQWVMPRHEHAGHHELIVLTQGGLEVQLGDDGRRLTARAGESLLYQRGVAHAERAVGSRPVNMICIAFETPDPLNGPEIAPDGEGRVRMLARWMADLLPVAADDDRRTLDALMVALMAERAARTRSEDHLVQMVRRHLRDHLAEAVTLDDLADLACLSRYHFARRFRAAAGVSPMAFVRRLRVEAARGLLMTPGVPLRWVAQQVGLQDEFHLSRVFKRITGQAPGAIRLSPARKG